MHHIEQIDQGCGGDEHTGQGEEFDPLDLVALFLLDRFQLLIEQLLTLLGFGMCRFEGVSQAGGELLDDLLL